MYGLIPYAYEAEVETAVALLTDFIVEPACVRAAAAAAAAAVLLGLLVLLLLLLLLRVCRPSVRRRPQAAQLRGWFRMYA